MEHCQNCGKLVPDWRWDGYCSDECQIEFEGEPKGTITHHDEFPEIEDFYYLDEEDNDDGSANT